MDLRQLRTWFFYALGVAIIVLMIWNLLLSDHGYFVYKLESTQQQNIEREIKELQLEKERLKGEIIRLRDDAKALEEVIHRELGFVYPDEYMFIMSQEKQQQPLQEIETKKEEE